MTRFVVCGETLIDLVRSTTEPSTPFRSVWEALSAGGPMNSAVALGQLGASVQFLGRLSDDAFGGQLREHIETADVGLELATWSSQATSVAVVSLDEQGVATYTFHFDDTANFGWQPGELPTLGEDDWLHVASLACVVGPGNEVLLDWMTTVRCGVSYDINVRPTVITDPAVYWTRVEPWLEAVGRRQGILKASDVDVELLAKAAGGSDPLEIVTGWVGRYGLGLAVLTLGADGAVAVEPGGSVTRVAGFPTDVVDTVGAGDTFMAGFLEGQVGQRLALEESLRRGAAAAAIVCSRQGAQPPTAAEVDALVDTGS